MAGKSSLREMPGGDEAGPARAWRRQVWGRRFRAQAALVVKAPEAMPEAVPHWPAERQEQAFLMRMLSGSGEGWPETMKREQQACRSIAEWRAWAEKWALQLGGKGSHDVPAVMVEGRPQPL